MVIRVLLADDHALFRQGLRRILEESPEIAVVAEASSTWEAEEMAALHRPDVAILDVQMPAPNGIAAVPGVLARSPGTAVMMLSIHRDRQYVTRSVRAGAKGYVLKDAPDEALLSAIRTVHAGEFFFSEAVATVAEDAVRRSAV